MGAILTAITQKDTWIVKCKLATDNQGDFAGLVPVDFTTPDQSRQDALVFAKALIEKVNKGYDADYFELKKPGVPAGANDVGVHCTTHNASFMGGPLSQKQVDAINACKDTFTLMVNLTDYKILVGAPSNDKHTGVIGYVGLLLRPDSLAEYNRAVEVYGGVKKEKYISHVSICGWNIKGFDTTIRARQAFGLITHDGQKYPNGDNHYTKEGFPVPADAKTLIGLLQDVCRKREAAHVLATEQSPSSSAAKTAANAKALDAAASKHQKISE